MTTNEIFFPDVINIGGTSTYIKKSGSDLIFKDANNTEKTLTELAASGGGSSFSGDVASTTQGYLNNTASSTPVQIQDDDGLAIANAAGTNSGIFTATGASELTLLGSLVVKRDAGLIIQNTAGSSTGQLMAISGNRLGSAGTFAIASSSAFTDGGEFVATGASELTLLGSMVVKRDAGLTIKNTAGSSTGQLMAISGNRLGSAGTFSVASSSAFSDGADLVATGTDELSIIGGSLVVKRDAGLTIKNTAGTTSGQLVALAGNKLLSAGTFAIASSTAASDGGEFTATGASELTLFGSLVVKRDAGLEIQKTDGTSGGIIAATSAGQLRMRASNGVTISDSTDTNTARLQATAPNELTVLGKLNVQSDSGLEIQKSDTTSGGSIIATSIGQLRVLADNGLTLSNNAGTATARLQPIASAELALFGKLLVQHDSGIEFQKTDGTSGGSFKATAAGFVSILANSGLSIVDSSGTNGARIQGTAPAELTVLGKLIVARDGGLEIQKTDGTSGGTVVATSAGLLTVSAGLSVNNDINVGGNIGLIGGGTLSSTANGDITVDPDGTGVTNIVGDVVLKDATGTFSNTIFTAGTNKLGAVGSIYIGTTRNLSISTELVTTGSDVFEIRSSTVIKGDQGLTLKTADGTLSSQIFVAGANALGVNGTLYIGTDRTLATSGEIHATAANQLTTTANLIVKNDNGFNVLNGAGSTHLFDVWPSGHLSTGTGADNGHGTQFAFNTLGTTKNLLRVTGTITSTTDPESGAYFGITPTAGSGSGARVVGVNAELLSGYTASGVTTGVRASNFTAGTGTDYIGGFGNFGLDAQSAGSTSGVNVAIKAAAGGSSSLNIAALLYTPNNHATARSVGAVLAANNSLAGGQTGAYVQLGTATPSFVNAALQITNGATSDPILVAQTNTSTAFQILSNGETDFTNKQAKNFRTENVATGSLPAAGNKGRLITDSTTNSLLFDDGTSLVALNTSDNSASFRNKLINGGFIRDLWQRGTSFSATGYTADRWRMELGTGESVTVSQQSFSLGQTDVPGEPQHYLQFNRTTTGSTPSKIGQRIEYVRTSAGKNIITSGYISGSTNFTLNVKATQNFGSGGSASVTTTIGSINVTAGFSLFSLAAAIPSISGKTIGSGSDDFIEVYFELPIAAGNVSFNLSQIQFEEGTQTTTFEVRPPAVEVPMALRFFNKTFPLTTTPAQNAGITGSIYADWGTSTGHVLLVWYFSERMRVPPSVVTYNPFANNSNFSNGGVEGVVSFVVPSQNQVAAIHDANAFSTEAAPNLHLTADGEL